MTINLTAYETLACRGQKTQATIDAIQVALLEDNGYDSQNTDFRPMNHLNSQLFLLDNDAGSNANIPAFVHPILVNSKQENRLVVDMRYFVTNSKNNPTLRLPVSMRSLPEYELHLARARFNHHWIENAGKSMLIFNAVPMNAFASWLHGAIGGRLSLDAQEKHLLRILCAYFYCCQFTNDTEWGQMEQHSVVGFITRNLRVSADDVVHLVGKLDVIRDLTMFCDVVKDKIDSVRLKDLNPGLVVAVVAGTWFGTNSREIVATALEHPPTWMALVQTAMTNRVFRNTDIAKRVALVIGRNDPKSTIQAFKALVQTD